MNTIVVGVDGSAPAQRALEFAAEEAVFRGARLHIISVWEIPPAVYGGGFTPALDQEALEAFRAHAESVVQDALEHVKQRHPDCRVEGATAEGQPAEMLLEEARNAGLIVVGNRGRGGFASLLLGSVSQQVVHHAPCPVVVVPHEEQHEQGDRP
jgi:nucleotide-binding universal stress UspA family protein